MDDPNVVLLYSNTPQAGCSHDSFEVLKVTIASCTVIKWASSEKVGLVPGNRSRFLGVYVALNIPLFLDLDGNLWLETRPRELCDQGIRLLLNTVVVR